MMRRMKISIATTTAAVAAVLFATPATAADDIHTGWTAWFNTIKLDERNSLISDVQVRSSDNWEDVRTVIGRVGVTRTWRPGVSFGVGAAYIETLNVGAPDISEYRIWQQAMFQSVFGAQSLTQRVRIEQRFIEGTLGEDKYSTRLRYSARFVVPIGDADRSGLGNYVALQNEAMLNVTGKDELNGRLFDQNRAYVAIGRRVGPGFDLEFGYLNQYVVGRSRDTSNHAIQASVYTRW